MTAISPQILLQAYSVGGTKSAPKPDTPKMEIEKPTFDTGFGIEKSSVVMDMTPFTVIPVTATPSSDPSSARKPNPVPPARVTSGTATPPGVGATASVPPGATRAATSPTGALPQTQGPVAAAIVLVPLTTPAPEYPRDAMISGTQGFVVVEFTVNTEGATQDIAVVDASPQRVFDQAARRAVSRWKFQPLLQNGMPIERRVQRRIDFKL